MKKGLGILFLIAFSSMSFMGCSVMDDYLKAPVVELTEEEKAEQFRNNKIAFYDNYFTNYYVDINSKEFVIDRENNERKVKETIQITDDTFAYIVQSNDGDNRSIYSVNNDVYISLQTSNPDYMIDDNGNCLKKYNVNEMMKISDKIPNYLYFSQTSVEDVIRTKITKIEYIETLEKEKVDKVKVTIKKEDFSVLVENEPSIYEEEYIFYVNFETENVDYIEYKNGNEDITIYYQTCQKINIPNQFDNVEMEEMDVNNLYKFLMNIGR